MGAHQGGGPVSGYDSAVIAGQIVLLTLVILGLGSLAACVFIKVTEWLARRWDR